MIASWLSWLFRGPTTDSRGAPPQTASDGRRPAGAVSRAAPFPAAPGRSSGLAVIIGRTGNVVIVRLRGEAGVGEAELLESALRAPAACRPAGVLLDLSELRSISSLAVGVLIAFWRGVVRAGGRVVLVDDFQPAVAAAVDKAELTNLFEVVGVSGCGA
jgi:anti-anti-sigma factor